MPCSGENDAMFSRALGGHRVGEPTKQKEAHTTELGRFLGHLLRDEGAVSAIEYGLLAVPISVIIIVALFVVGTDIASIFDYIASTFDHIASWVVGQF